MVDKQMWFPLYLLGEFDILRDDFLLWYTWLHLKFASPLKMIVPLNFWDTNKLQTKSTGTNLKLTPTMRSWRLNLTREQKKVLYCRPLVLFYSSQCPKTFALTHEFIIRLQSKYSCHYGCVDGLECRRSGSPSPLSGKPQHPHPHHHGKCVRPAPPTEEPGSGDMDEFWT